MDTFNGEIRYNRTIIIFDLSCSTGGPNEKKHTCRRSSSC